MDKLAPTTALPNAKASDAQALKAMERARYAQKSGDASQLKEAAQQLEAVFLGMMLEEMGKTVDTSGGLFPATPGNEMYQEWFRKEVAKQWASSGGVGLSDLAYRSVGNLSPSVGQIERAYAPASLERPEREMPIQPVTGRITSGFGERIHPITGESHFHNGVDIAVPVGTPIHSPWSGVVSKITENSRGGLMVKIEHPDGYTTGYAHNSDITVKIGQHVLAGQIVAYSGNTGQSTGPHLHFSLYHQGKPTNPKKILNLGDE